MAYHVETLVTHCGDCGLALDVNFTDNVVLDAEFMATEGEMARDALGNYDIKCPICGAWTYIPGY